MGAIERLALVFATLLLFGLSMMIAFSINQSGNTVFSISGAYKFTLASQGVNLPACYQQYTGILESQEFVCRNGGKIGPLTPETAGVIEYQSKQSWETTNQCLASSSTANCAGSLNIASLINDWQSKCVSEVECNFNLGKYMNSPNTGSGCYKDQNKIFVQFNCTLDED
jgi:hypothetical protein